MIDIPLPKPWHERATEDAALLASAPLIAPPATPPAPPSRPLPLRIEPLGEREVRCDSHGAYVSQGRRIGGRVEIWSGCAACADDERRQAEAKRDAAEAAARRARLEDVLRRSCLPERFVGRTFDSYEAETPAQQKALRLVRSFAETFDQHERVGTTLMLAGNRGTGKSHLACAAIQALAPSRFGLYLTTMGLLRMVRETWRKDAKRSEGEVLAELARVDLLVVDEVGVQYDTEGERVLLFEILDRRYLDLKPSILITNLRLDDFRSFVGERITDRLRETGKWIPFEWDSHRTSRAAA